MAVSHVHTVEHVAPPRFTCRYESMLAQRSSGRLRGSYWPTTLISGKKPSLGRRGFMIRGNFVMRATDAQRNSFNSFCLGKAFGGKQCKEENFWTKFGLPTVPNLFTRGKTFHGTIHPSRPNPLRTDNNDRTPSIRSRTKRSRGNEQENLRGTKLCKRFPMRNWPRLRTAKKPPPKVCRPTYSV